MKEPLNQFADRIRNNGEVAEFIRGLIAKGVDPSEIARIALEDESYTEVSLQMHMAHMTGKEVHKVHLKIPDDDFQCTTCVSRSTSVCNNPDVAGHYTRAANPANACGHFKPRELEGNE